MKKILVTIDLTKIDKKKVIKETYTNKNGETITKQVYRLEVVPLKEPQSVGSGKMQKTHFVAEGQTKEERAAKAPTNFIGDGLMFVEDSDFGGF